MYLLFYCSSLDSFLEILFFYMIFRQDLQSPVAFYQVVFSLVLYDDTQELQKYIADFIDFLFLQVAPSLLGGPVEGIVLFDVEAVVFFDFGLQGHICSKANHFFLWGPWDLVANKNVIVHQHILYVL